MRFLISFFLVLVLGFVSCGNRDTQRIKKDKDELRFGKVLKSKDIQLKYDYRVKSFERGDTIMLKPIFV